MLRDEPEAKALYAAIRGAKQLSMSAGNDLEAAIVSDAKGQRGAVDLLDLFLAEAGVDIVSVTANQARIAREAYRRFGRATHRAGLNFGDCFAYALAKETGRSLLFKGDDFAQTDIEAAIAL